MLEGYDGSNSLLADNGNEELTTKENQEEIFTPKITLHVLIGWTVPKTMRVFAKIGSHHVIVLIDSGSLHNFISERMANLLRLPVVPTNTFSIRLPIKRASDTKGGLRRYK
jgi:predicted ATPase with chaperone activity